MSLTSARKVACALALATALPLAVVPAAAQSPAPQPAAPVAAAPAAGGAGLEPPAGALVPAGPPPDVDLIYSGDVIGYIDPCG